MLIVESLGKGQKTARCKVGDIESVAKINVMIDLETWLGVANLNCSLNAYRLVVKSD